MSSTPFDSFFEDYSVVVRGATETTREAVLHMNHLPADGRMLLKVYDVAANDFPHEFESTDPADVKDFFHDLAEAYNWEPPVWLIENVEIYLNLLPKSFNLSGGIWNDGDDEAIADIEAYYFPAINPVYSASIAARCSWSNGDYISVGDEYSADSVADVINAVTAYRDAALTYEGASSVQAAEADAFLAKVAAL